MIACRYLLLFAIIVISFAGVISCSNQDDDDEWTDDDAGDDDDNVQMDDSGVDDTSSTDDDSGWPDDDTAPDDDIDDDLADDTSSDDTGADDTGPDDDLVDDDASAIFTIDFESYPLGDLGAPWYKPVDSGDSTAKVVILTKDGSGKGLKIDGGVAAGDSIGVGYLFGDYSTDMRFNVDVRVEPGAVFGMQILQHRSTQYIIEAEINNEDDVSMITAHNTLSGVYTDCGPMITGEWFKLSVIFDYASCTYDVLINNAFTSCSDVAMAHATPAPFSAIGFIDYGTEDLGGIFNVDNVAGKNFTP